MYINKKTGGILEHGRTRGDPNIIPLREEFVIEDELLGGYIEDMEKLHLITQYDNLKDVLLACNTLEKEKIVLNEMLDLEKRIKDIR